MRTLGFTVLMANMAVTTSVSAASIWSTSTIATIDGNYVIHAVSTDDLTLTADSFIGLYVDWYEDDLDKESPSSLLSEVIDNYYLGYSYFDPIAEINNIFSGYNGVDLVWSRDPYDYNFWPVTEDITVSNIELFGWDIGVEQWLFACDFDSAGSFGCDSAANIGWQGFDSLGTDTLTFDNGLTMTASSYVEPTPPTIVPVPAAVWLFGSGMLGLIGVARRKAA